MNTSLPDAWAALKPTDWTGTVLVFGGTDTGKSTLVRLLFEGLRAAGRRVAVIDGDPGQPSLGPPTTLTAALAADDASYPPSGSTRHTFVGATTPRGHMLEMVVGLRRLADAVESAADITLVDTSGFIAVRHGGRALKMAILDVLRPSVILGLQRDDELAPLLVPLRQSRRFCVIDLPVPEAARKRSTKVRRENRAARYAVHFEEAELRDLYWPDVSVRPNLNFREDQIVGLVDRDGYTRALGRIDAVDRAEYTLRLQTPCPSFDTVDTVCCGDVRLDPQSFADAPL
jgi:polynucleotide 5'-hydroxyl-kinase GRC3/NOL9